jgi:hypothetical protein
MPICQNLTSRENLGFSVVDLMRIFGVNRQIMAIEFSKAVGLIAAIASAAKRLSDTRVEVKVNDVAIQLQGIVLDLQSEMMIIQSDYQGVLRSKEELEKKLIEQEGWDKERARYHLEKAGAGDWFNFVYALKAGTQPVEPAHWLCTHCYEDKKKSVLLSRPNSRWYCPRCNTEVLIGGLPKQT